MCAQVNDLLSLLSDFGGSGTSDVNGDGTVDVNDLLQVLGVFGGDCGPTNVAGGSDGTEEVNCCGGGAACGFVHCPALGAGQDGCIQPWAMPNGMDFDTDCAAVVAVPVPVEECNGCCPAGAACFAPDPPCCANLAPACVQGDDCGGQVWNDCGTSCPAMCGQPPAMMCNMMCNAAFQCPNSLSWDATLGACVSGEDCTEVFVLPPGMALGRPFLTVEESASTASPVEVVSDWLIVV